MNAEERMRMIRIVEKLERNKEYGKRLGIKNTSVIKKSKSS